MDVAEFLTARLDEAQALAEAAREIDPAPWSAGVDEEGPGPEGRAVRGNGLVIAADEVGLWDTEGSFLLCMTVPTTRHVAYWDPAHVLREIEAKRTLIRIYQRAVSELNHHCEVVERASHPPVRGLDAFIAEMHRADAAVREWKSVLEVHASVYENHSDYDKAWSLPD